MFKEQIEAVRRALGRDQAHERSRWLAPLALAAAVVTAAFALLASRLRREPASDQPVQSGAAKAGAAAQRSGADATKSVQSRAKRQRKPAASRNGSSTRRTSAARSNKEADTGPDKRTAARTRRTAA